MLSTNIKNETQTRILIIGAGAAGLQCAHRLIHEHGYDPKDMVVVEARNRIGGRVWTSEIEVKKGEGNDTETILMDLGAAWVHGTGWEWNGDADAIMQLLELNPMMKLLQQQHQATETEGNIYSHNLDHVVDGNPWMRPHTMLHKAGQLAIYVGGEGGKGLLSDVDDHPMIHSALARHFKLMREVSEYGQRLFNNGEGIQTTTTSFQDAIDAVQTGVDGKKESRWSPEVKTLSRFYQHLIECWYGAPADDLQLSEFIDKEEADNDDSSDDTEDEDAWDSEYYEEGDFYGPHCTLKKGMMSVLEPLLPGGVRERIQLESVVTKLTWDETNQRIRATVDDKETLEAECCVTTASIGCLQHATGDGALFDPPLSADKIEAIGTFRMASYKKVFLTFDSIFWPTEPAFIGMVRTSSIDSDPPVLDSELGNYVLFDNLWANHGLPCLEAVLFAKAGAWSAHKPDDEIRAKVLSFMQEAMCVDFDVSSRCVDCHVTHWEEDLHSRGAYSNLGPGSRMRHADEIRKSEWDGRLLIAGEATIEMFQGSVHAALFSGTTTADNVHQLLKGKKK